MWDMGRGLVDRLTQITLAIVMVGPQPMASARGRTNADAAAENTYRTTIPLISIITEYRGIRGKVGGVDDSQLFTAMTSAERVCMQSTALIQSASDLISKHNVLPLCMRRVDRKVAYYVFRGVRVIMSPNPLIAVITRGGAIPPALTGQRLSSTELKASRSM